MAMSSSRSQQTAGLSDLRLSTLRREHAQAKIQEDKIREKSPDRLSRLSDTLPRSPGPSFPPSDVAIWDSTSATNTTPLDQHGDSDLSEAWPFPAWPSEHKPQQNTPSTLHGAHSPRSAEIRRKELVGGNNPVAEGRESSPWIGAHAEDILSDHSIRHGYSTKSELVTETGTARSTLWPHLKNRTGLNGLSSLFGALLQDRCTDGKLPSTSTFKPPPRVTLTDQKREAWLKDLANPAVPLRKQSRTIPHGVKGKVLLEQCLLKQISMTRAVWLARCVGANELRAFRRKGVSIGTVQENEQRWMHEWTTLVEAFVDEQTSYTSNHSDRKRNFAYVLHLSSRLFTEGLLDTEHYVNWITHKILTCSLEQLPVALLIAQTHQTVFFSSAKLGQGLAKACLTRLDDLRNQVSSGLVLAPLKERLESFIGAVVCHSPDSFLMGDAWISLRSAFANMQTEVSLERRAERAEGRVSADYLERIIRRNDYAAHLTSRKCVAHEVASINILELLDRCGHELCTSELSKLCMKEIPDFQILTSILVRWSASIHRSGIHRAYLVCRLLRYWRDTSVVDAGSFVLGEVKTLRNCPFVCARSLARLVAELVRDGLFPVSRYLKALLTGGGLKEDSQTDAHVLLELPLQYVSHNLCSIPAMILRSSEVSVPVPYPGTDQPLLKQQIRAFTNKALHGLTRRSEEWTLLPDLTLHSANDLFRLTPWLRAGLIASLSALPTRYELGTNQVLPIVTLVDCVNDYAELSPVFQAIAPKCDMDGLLQLCHSVEIRYRTLSAHGTLDRVWQSACKRYRELRSSHAPHRGVAASLFRTLLPPDRTLDVEQYLKQELVFCDANETMAAATPMSDGFDSSQELGGDLDRLLASGSTMEPPLLSSTIALILSRLADGSSNLEESPLVTVLTSLKSANESSFQPCLLSWLATKLPGLGQAAFSELLTAVFRAECLTLSDYVSFANDSLELAEASGNPLQASPSVRICTLQYLFLDGPNANEQTHSGDSANPTIRVPDEIEALHALRRAQFCRNSARELLHWVALELPCENTSPTHKIMTRMLQQRCFLDALRNSILSCSEGMGAQFEAAIGDPQSNFDLTSRLVCMLVQADDSTAHRLSCGDVDTNCVDVVSQTIIKVNEVALPFQRLTIMFATRPRSSAINPSKTMARAFLDQIRNTGAGLQSLPLWFQLVSAVHRSVARELRSLCEDMLLVGHGQCFSSEPADDEVDPSLYVNIIVLAKSGDSELEPDPTIGRRIAQQLQLAVQGFDQSSARARAAEWTCALADMALIDHRSCSLPGNVGTVVLSLLRLLTLGTIWNLSRLVERVYDASLLLTSCLSAKQVTKLRTLLEDHGDSRVRYVLGSLPEPDALFHLTQASTHASLVLPLPKWELLPSTANNETALSAHLFGAKKMRD